MKILYVGHTYTVRANQAKIAALARALPTAKISLLTPHAWRGPLYENQTDRFDSTLASNVEHHILHGYGIGKEGAYLFGPALFRLIATLKPDIVHVEQGAYALVYTQILIALKLVAPNARALFFTWWNLPYTPRGIKRITERFNLRNSAAAVAGNETARDILESHGFMEPIHVLPQLGIDLDDYRPRPFNPHPSPFVIGYAGRITEEKGVYDLVEAAALLKDPNIALHFVGSGDALEQVKRNASNHQIPLVYHAAVKNDELPALLASMNVLVLPSRSTSEWVEQFGHILIEAMAMGIPVIGSSSGEIPHVIGNAGLIFPEGDVMSLADKLRLLVENADERERLSTAGAVRVWKYFTHDVIARQQAQLYEWMLGEGKPVGSLFTKRATVHSSNGGLREA